MDSCSLLQAWQGCFLEIRKVAESHRQGTAHKGMILGVPDIWECSSGAVLWTPTAAGAGHSALQHLCYKTAVEFQFWLYCYLWEIKQDIRKYLTLRSDSPFPLFPCFLELVGFEEPWCCSKSFLTTTVWTGLISL